MCGIAGLVAGPGAARVDADAAHSMCAPIVHRGPDDEGVHAAEGVSIGMRRLSIIDLASGHQPIHNETRDVWLVFNGEIYNYRELRAQLVQCGHRFYTQSDSEVIVHAYEQFGRDCFARLRGMFAIAIWDARTRELTLARDRFGKKPLFYALLPDGRLAFGSELKSLLVLPALARELDPMAIRDYLLFGYVPTPRSVFRQVRKLEPGSWLSFGGGRLARQRYWQLAFEPKLTGSEEELAERLREEIDDAVRVRLVSDVPFGAFLSGGLDSSVVTAFMARHLHEPVRTFTIGFREARYDETEDARRVATHFGTRHEQLIVDPDAAALLERLVYYLDEPFGDSSAIPTYVVSELARRHVKMVLSGDGGDEMFGGYSRYGRYLTLRRLQRAGGAMLAPALAGLGKVAGGNLGRRAQSLAGRLGAIYPGSYLSGVALMTPELATSMLAGATPDASYGEVAAGFGGDLRHLGMLDQVIAGDIGSYLLDDILVKVDRMTMANSIEARAPLLDQQLAEFAARLPESMKWRGGLGKRLFRRVAAAVLPPECLAKRKQGFAIPLREWFCGPLHTLLLDRLANPNRLSGMLDYALVRRLAEEHRRQGIDRSEPLWLALNLEMWWQVCVLDGVRS
jgi:asparagine synthase (glutamine-hydrolysing)